MAKWRISAASSETGREVRLTVTAPSRESAEQKARERGFLISSVSLLEDEADMASAGALPPPPAALLDDPMNGLASAVPTPRSSRTLPYRHPATPKRQPDYPGIEVGGFVMRVMAWIYIAIAGIALLAGLFIGLGAMIEYDSLSMAVAAGGIPLLYALAMAAGGALFLWFASVGFAIRDIARNSFRHG